MEHEPVSRSLSLVSFLSESPALLFYRVRPFLLSCRRATRPSSGGRFFAFPVEAVSFQLDFPRPPLRGSRGRFWEIVRVASHPRPSIRSKMIVRQLGKPSRWPTKSTDISFSNFVFFPLLAMTNLGSGGRHPLSPLHFRSSGRFSKLLCANGVSFSFVSSLFPSLVVPSAANVWRRRRPFFFLHIVAAYEAAKLSHRGVRLFFSLPPNANSPSYQDVPQKQGSPFFSLCAAICPEGLSPNFPLPVLVRGNSKSFQFVRRDSCPPEVNHCSFFLSPTWAR